MTTVRFWTEIEIEAEIDYSPAEQQVLAPNDSAYPGSPEEVSFCGCTALIKGNNGRLRPATLVEVVEAELTEARMFELVWDASPDPSDYDEDRVNIRPYTEDKL